MIYHSPLEETTYQMLYVENEEQYFYLHGWGNPTMWEEQGAFIFDALMQSVILEALPDELALIEQVRSDRGGYQISIPHTFDAFQLGADYYVRHDDQSFEEAQYVIFIFGGSVEKMSEQWQQNFENHLNKTAGEDPNLISHKLIEWQGFSGAHSHYETIYEGEQVRGQTIGLINDEQWVWLNGFGIPAHWEQEGEAVYEQIFESLEVFPPVLE
jgi:hypothetical protein